VDPLGRSFAATYDAAGRRAQLNSPNGTATSYAYDARDRLTSVSTIAGATQVQYFGYTLDAVGNRLRVAEADGTTRQYAYDGIDRLTSETVSGSLAYAKSFAYDAVGNRLSQVTTGAGAATVSYAYDTRDRLTSENATAYSYDANGNVASKSGEATYAWDFESRLSSVTLADGTVVKHVYDVDGNRVQSTVTPSGGSASVTSFLVDASGAFSHVVSETDGTGVLTAVYVRADDELLSVMRPSGGWTTRYVHHDALGSVRVLTDETGVVADSRSYEAFGTMNAHAGNDPLPYGFTGEPFDATSKLAYHRARWMDSRVGRFFGIDPMLREANASGLHPYLYGNNNPVLLIDPTGRLSLPEINITGIIGAVLSTMARVAVPIARLAANPAVRLAFTSFSLFRVATTVENEQDPDLAAAVLEFYLTRLPASEIGPSPWKLDTAQRGIAIEKMLGKNLPSNFPTIDSFDYATNTAISIKSIDLGAKTYQKASGLRSVIRTAYQDLSTFTGGFKAAGVEIPEAKALELVVGIPKGASTIQSSVMGDMVAEAQSVGVRIRFVEIP
jgi:RHS repeat-associated protein